MTNRIDTNRLQFDVDRNLFSIQGLAGRLDNEQTKKDKSKKWTCHTLQPRHQVSTTVILLQ